ncbi:endo-alpha-N-acetylgalactosaminidase family protein [Actinomadura sp. ATCC 31491]|uniref:Endo-alpha-N-acetylgalactosaminidase family protein n=1 Tax=Actinomadura luzonensis TaxID=2805427 RepID=A0ABT0G946_9ACTN|nr:endo-alpha-N-acetylgalactosaminidase family protein [Actinomadura luzonensis]MCK2220908.1 endo-alpha-N-acetylgalactosaminidase family protein [Actinomadura luzonensis]
MRRGPVVFAAALALTLATPATAAGTREAPAPPASGPPSSGPPSSGAAPSGGAGAGGAGAAPAPSPTYELPSPEPSPTGPPPPSPTAQNVPPVPARVAGPIAISSAALRVELDPAFPRVLGYTDRATGATLGGGTAVPAVVLNGTPRPAEVTLTGRDAATARYRLAFPGLPGVALAASVGVRGRVTTFRIDEVRDTPAFRVGTIDLPGHDLVSVSSDRPGAATAFTRLDPNATRTADVIAPVTAATAPDAAPVGASYAILSTARLAAAVETNSTYDRPSGVTDHDAARLWHQARRDASGAVGVAVWSGQWTHRADGSPFTEEPPWAKVVVTPDANGDGTVDWQDGAIAFRQIAITPPGAGRTKERVAAHIPFNFSSQATHPFLRTLDDVKRISLATDGLGQLALLKGYQSEGHDSAHPDYGGNYNRRAGGLADLRTLLRAGRAWNAEFGAHVNATEAYPEARNFSEQLADPDAKGWNWLDQAYLIDQRGDLTRGTLARRFAQLRRETGGDLALVYVDVYRPFGWLADRLLTELRAQGWQVATEWSDKLERGSLWSHWANDLGYGGVTNKGLNSQIIRFIRNDEKDVWNPHPILGNARIVEFEGWQARNDFTAFLRNVWENNLPAKFLQHYKIMRWGPDEIDFTGGVRGTYRDGRRELFAGGHKVLDGPAYLLPWGGRFYHYNAAGGETTWDADRAMSVYRLTDQGRVPEGTVTPVGGKVTLRAEAGVAYVLYPGGAPAQADPRWGQGSGLRDPGFNSDGLDGWSASGPVRAGRDALGRRFAVLGGGAEAALEQRLTGLQPGRVYTASAFVEVEPGRTRATTLAAGGARATVERSTARDYIASDDKHDTFFQRLSVPFTAGGGPVTLRIAAAAGDGDVRVDDVRLLPGGPPGPVETFESGEPGWGPFVKGDAGGSFDARTHRSERHEPYTQAGWHGKTVDDVLRGDWSLKAHEERQGLIYRTLPQTARFAAGHAYEVSFAYQNAQADTYQWVTGYDTGPGASVETRRTTLPEQRTTAVFSERVTGGCGDVWVGLRSLRPEQAGADFVLDDFAVTDLGPAGDAPACATLEVTPGVPAFEQGAANEVGTVFTNREESAVRDVRVTLEAPAGWTVTGDGAGEAGPGGTLTTTWQVTPPADAPHGTYELKAAAAYTVGGVPRTVTATARVRTLPPPPQADVYASDLEWVSAANGWGPVERDRSNGDTGEADGGPIVIGGRTFAKGLGTHAPARVRYFLGGRCTAFRAFTGVDDVQATRGSVRFTVLADGAERARSPVLRAADEAYELVADVSGARYADLVADDGGDGNGNDHADWGEARFTCS